MNKHLLTLAAVLATALATPSAVDAAVPNIVPLQGRIAVDDANFNGTGYFKFVIYQRFANQPATQLWNSSVGATSAALAEPATSVALPVWQGTYLARLGYAGFTPALPASLEPEAQKDVSVRVWFSPNNTTFQQILPDTQLHSVPFARSAASAATFGGLIPSQIARLDTANTFTHIDGITIQGTPPNANLPAAGATVPVTGAGSRMEYLPGYGAFRVGTVGDVNWSAANIGVHSIGIGSNTLASGISSLAIGGGSEATQPYSTAIGLAAHATASYATAIGRGPTASGNGSIAIGERSVASGPYAVAIGLDCEAIGQYSTAMGYSPLSGGANSTALGTSTIASGQYATALGHFSEASGDASTAMGERTYARSFAETVIGLNNLDYTPDNATAWDADDRLFVVGNGRTSSSRSNAFVLFKSGNATLQGTLTQGSDRHRKTDIVPVNTAAVLAKVAALPLATWKYLDEHTTHLGPMAQDFFAAFQLGGTDTGIAAVDADGVALASIQALERQLSAKDARIAQLEARLVALEAKLR